MQAYAEGFELFQESEFELDNAKIAHLWNQGSVIRSWLCELAARAFEAEGNDLAGLEGWVEDSGEGRWTLAGRDRPRRSGSGPQRRAQQPLLLARAGGLQRPRARRAAQPVRRSRRQEERIVTVADLGPNPLAQGLERLPVPPTNLVIFGATGDLARRKLLPADLQPRPRGGAARALQPDRGLPRRALPRGVPRDRRRVDPHLLAHASRRERARRAARRAALRAGRVRRRRRPTRRSRATLGGARRARRRADGARLLPLDRAGVLPGDRRGARRRRARAAPRGATCAW